MAAGRMMPAYDDGEWMSPSRVVAYVLDERPLASMAAVHEVGGDFPTRRDAVRATIDALRDSMGERPWGQGTTPDPK